MTNQATDATSNTYLIDLSVADRALLIERVLDAAFDHSEQLAGYAVWLLADGWLEITTDLLLGNTPDEGFANDLIEVGASLGRLVEGGEAEVLAQMHFSLRNAGCYLRAIELAFKPKLRLV